MKVVDRKTFLKLPEGTVYSKGCKWAFDDLRVKGESWDSDFIYIHFNGPMSYDTHDWLKILEDSLKNGTSFEMNTDTSRDGLFEEDALFLIYEKEDLQVLKEYL